ncbi:hypothetical protein IC229_13440 [Spirosoma sp. BT702]|uniref:Uncharacterized protein n=1 Tax=Spirosoma profusum TaxID=2771354 RepID=A0A926XW86_9BACT|nr:hypothetical protein [Spirosoma profusum]MBD2701649.1 hypothetical protein [Spirosoma profusum]
MRKILNFLTVYLLVLASVLPAPAQVRYKAAKRADGSQVIYKEHPPNSGVFSTTVSVLPSDAARARVAGRVLLPYALEGQRQYNPDQFGLGNNKYFSETFKFSVDFNMGNLTVAQRKRQGMNFFNVWSMIGDPSSPSAEKYSVPNTEGFYYMTESALHGAYEGARYFESNLEVVEAYLINSIPSLGVPGSDPYAGTVAFNIESSNDWKAANYGNGGHWPPADGNKPIRLESPTAKSMLGGNATVSLSTLLGNPGAMEIEGGVRRSNRLCIMFAIARQKGATNLKIYYGSSNKQGYPKTSDATDYGQFLGQYNADPSLIPGFINDGSNRVVLNGHTYKLQGNQWDLEDHMLGYFYPGRFDISKKDWCEIWGNFGVTDCSGYNQKSAPQNYPYLWSKTKPVHYVAEEKGYYQACRIKMKQNQGKYRGILRMIETFYEPDIAAYIDGVGVPTRAPFSQLFGTLPFNNDTPKVWFQPVRTYTIYCVGRFFAGNDPGWGLHVFISNEYAHGDLNSHEFRAYNHELHPYTTLFQARADMQPYEVFFNGSTLVEDPEVQIGGSGNFEAYTGLVAYNNAEGSSSSAGQKPCYMLRYKDMGTYWRVLILGGYNQDWTAEHTDVVRAPNGLLNGNSFEIKLRGPGAQIYDFYVKKTDNNQRYKATPTAQTLWEKAGYSGRVGSAQN